MIESYQIEKCQGQGSLSVLLVGSGDNVPVEELIFIDFKQKNNPLLVYIRYFNLNNTLGIKKRWTDYATHTVFRVVASLLVKKRGMQ